MFLVNSRLGLFAAAPSRGRPFSLGYGAILPSSLTTVRPLASVCSTSPPVSVSVRARATCPAAFLGPPPRPASPMRFAGWPGRVGGRACLPPPGRHRTGASRTRPGLVGAVPASVGSGRARRRNVCLPPLAYGSRPRLRPRLTLGGRAFPRKPRAFGAGDSHPRLATRASILTPARSTAPRRRRFAARGKLPYRCSVRLHPAASARSLAP